MEEMISYIFYIVNNLMYPNEYDRKELMEYLRSQISDVDITSDSDHSFYVGYDKKILLSENFDFHSFNGDIENMINDILSEGEVVYLTDSEKNRITNRFIRGFNHSFPKLYKHDELESILDTNVKAIEQNELYDSRYFRDQKKIRLTNTRNSLVAFHEFVHALHTGYDEYNGKYYHGIDEGFTELATLVHKNGVINNRYCELDASNNGYKDLVSNGELKDENGKRKLEDGRQQRHFLFPHKRCACQRFGECNPHSRQRTHDESWTIGKNQRTKISVRCGKCRRDTFCFMEYRCTRF